MDISTGKWVDVIASEENDFNHNVDWNMTDSDVLYESKHKFNLSFHLHMIIFFGFDKAIHTPNWLLHLYCEYKLYKWVLRPTI